MIGTNGTMTVDEDRLYNGSPERFNWTLIGKREVYVPANAFKPNTGDIKYADMLTPNHPNPDYMRYELRRVWVLEAKLKEATAMCTASVCCLLTKTPGTQWLRTTMTAVVRCGSTR